MKHQCSLLSPVDQFGLYFSTKCRKERLLQKNENEQKKRPVFKKEIRIFTHFCHSRPLFLLFSSFLQIVNMFNKSCLWLDLNQCPLVLEATALPTAPQQLPNFPDSYQTVVDLYEVEPR